MNRKLLSQHIQIGKGLPAILCGNLEVPCRQRRKNKSCRCDACGYAVQTAGNPIWMKKFLLEYSKL